jgi:Helicase C-terminal domain/Type III restriction enzyme, res subunit
MGRRDSDDIGSLRQSIRHGVERKETMMDFKSLAVRQAATTLTSPREIFAALPRKEAGYGYLRDVQGQVLDDWVARRSEHDIAIKMNTGAGKTVVGLLILQASANEGFGPALYVAPTSYLVRQARKQAQRLGMATTEDPESADYRAGRLIAVVNAHRLVNGLSVFGGPGSTRGRPIPIGTVVIDDAHAALAIVEEQCTISVAASHPAFELLFGRFESDLRAQSESAVIDLKERDPSAVLRVPFWAWASQAAEVYSVLRRHIDEDPFKFVVPMIRDSLSISSAVFSSTQLEIRPPYPPTSRITAFDRAKRRIYLTATLADDGALVAAFDADATSVRQSITPSTASDLGDRLILAPQEVSPRISDEEIRQAAKDLSKRLNVVVLVPSFRRAEHWINVADLTAAADEIDSAVDSLRAGHVGLAVLVSKYDGIDLPDEACRILILDGIPQSYGGLERREAVILGDSDAMTSRQLQRIEQGMGRGVRSNEDYCVVLLMGRRLTQLISDASQADRLSPATRAQLGLSREVALRLVNKPLAEILVVVDQVLGRDPDWVEASRSILAGVTYPPGQVTPEVAHSRAAFNAADAGQFVDAIERMQSAVQATLDPRVKGWRMEQQAVYEDRVDQVKAQQVLAAAIALNPRVMKPRAGVSARRVSASSSQAQSVAGYLERAYSTGTQMLIALEAILDAMVFDPERTDDFEDSVERLAPHLGFVGSRPERETGNGPDALWAIASQNYVVIECKSGATTDMIPRKDLAQLAHSTNWFTEVYGSGPRRTPLLIHPTSILRPDAVASRDDMIMTREKLEAFRSAVRAMYVALSLGRTWADERAVGEQLRALHLTSGDIVTSFAVRPTARRSRP